MCGSMKEQKKEQISSIIITVCWFEHVELSCPVFQNLNLSDTLANRWQLNRMTQLHRSLLLDWLYQLESQGWFLRRDTTRNHYRKHVPLLPSISNGITHEPFSVCAPSPFCVTLLSTYWFSPLRMDAFTITLSLQAAFMFTETCLLFMTKRVL